jgi:hypothetical protein
MAVRSGPDGEKKSARDRATERMNVRVELSRLEVMIEELKVEYEQYFLGFRPYAPDKEHKIVERKIRDVRKAPFKNSEMTYRLRSLESRFQTYNNYWQRTMRQREAGTYSKDVFKANMRERHAREEAEANTAKGKAQRQMRELYDSYKSALEKQTGKKANVEYGSFKKSLAKRAKEYQEKNGKKKLTFKVVMKDGKVSVQAREKK